MSGVASTITPHLYESGSMQAPVEKSSMHRGRGPLLVSSITGVLQPLYRDHKRKNSVTELGSVAVYFLSNYCFVESTPPLREGVQGDPILS